MTDQQKICAVELALDGRLSLELVKQALGIDHNDSDGALQLLIESFNLNEDKSRWGL